MKEIQPLVSVVIPCYNQAKYLPGALESLLMQTHQNWECIIVSDGSPDNVNQVANEWVEKDERFTYVKKKRGAEFCEKCGANKSKWRLRAVSGCG